MKVRGGSRWGMKRETGSRKEQGAIDHVVEVRCGTTQVSGGHDTKSSRQASGPGMALLGDEV
eukprot:586640-Rhodomonas_salina.7